MRRDTARVAGKRLLDDGAPQSVMAAVVAAVHAAGAHPRATVMLDHLTLDGDVEDGGGLVASARFLIWSPDSAGLDALAGQLRAALPAEWSEGPMVPGIEADPAVTATVFDALRAAGRVPVEGRSRSLSRPISGRSPTGCPVRSWGSVVPRAGPSTRPWARSSSVRRRDRGGHRHR